MGHEAEVEEIETTGIEEVEETEEELPEESPKGDETEETETTDEEEEVEIIREATLPQADNQQGIRKRINKLNAKVEKAETKAGEIDAELELERERNKLLQIALDQQKQKPANEAPNPDDFDLGRDDPEFIQKYEEHLTSKILSQVEGKFAETTKQTQSTTQQEAETAALIRKQTSHYEKVKDLKVKDYLNREDQALEILGTDAVNYIIKKVPDAHNMLYYLGTEQNRADAERLASLTKTDVEDALLEIGRLSAELRVKPKPKPSTAPNPDEEIQGGVSSVSRKRTGPTFE